VPDAGIAKGLKAGDWLRDACAVMGGKGGGKPDNAMGGGTDPTKVREAIATAHAMAHKFLA
jgi:alanyl-tRNA synthetase